MTFRLLFSTFLAGAINVQMVMAGPITGQGATAQPTEQTNAPQGGSATETSFSAGSLFDHSGSPLLLTSGLHYLELGTRNKLRHVDGGGFSDYSGGYSSAAGGAGSAGMTGGPGGLPVGNLAPELPLGSTAPLDLIMPVSIPEPTALMLLAPALFLFARQRSRARR
jgi:hypothetical protein